MQNLHTSNQEQRITDLTDRLLQDMTKGRTIDAVMTFDHPNKDIVIDMIYKLRSIIFPGYFRS